MKLLICYFAAKGTSVRLDLVWVLHRGLLRNPDFLAFLGAMNPGKHVWPNSKCIPSASGEKRYNWGQCLIFNLSFEVSWWSGFVFSHRCHSLQLSSNVLQNRSKCLEKVHVVLGNKSCDLDSLISTLAYAYFLDKVLVKMDRVVLTHLLQVVTDTLLLSQLKHTVKTLFWTTILL